MEYDDARRKSRPDKEAKLRKHIAQLEEDIARKKGIDVHRWGNMQVILNFCD